MDAIVTVSGRLLDRILNREPRAIFTSSPQQPMKSRRSNQIVTIIVLTETQRMRQPRNTPVEPGGKSALRGLALRMCAPNGQRRPFRIPLVSKLVLDASVVFTPAILRLLISTSGITFLRTAHHGFCQLSPHRADRSSPADLQIARTRARPA